VFSQGSDLVREFLAQENFEGVKRAVEANGYAIMLDLLHPGVATPARRSA